MLFLFVTCFIGIVTGTYNYTEDDPNCLCVSQIPGWCKVDFGAHVNPSCVYPDALPFNGPAVYTTEELAVAAKTCEADPQCKSFQHRRNGNEVIQYCVEKGYYYREQTDCDLYKQASKCNPATGPHSTKAPYCAYMQEYDCKSGLVSAMPYQVDQDGVPQYMAGGGDVTDDPWTIALSGKDLVISALAMVNIIIFVALCSVRAKSGKTPFV